jgi:hypothetical protein
MWTWVKFGRLLRTSSGAGERGHRDFGIAPGRKRTSAPALFACNRHQAERHQWKRWGQFIQASEYQAIIKQFALPPGAPAAHHDNEGTARERCWEGIGVTSAFCVRAGANLT